MQNDPSCTRDSNGLSAPDGIRGREEFYLRGGGASNATPTTNSDVFLLVQLGSSGTPNISHCDDLGALRALLEALLTEGVSAENVEVFRGSKLRFSVAYRPVVKLVGA